MKYVDRLLQDTEYLELADQLEQAEAARIFCRHGLSHFLDVARIAWIMVLEQAALTDNGAVGRWKADEGVQTAETWGKEPELLKEKIYLTALLHDLGRLEEAELGTPHHEAGARLAQKLLDKIGYPREEQREILSAILGHRGEHLRNGLSDISGCQTKDKLNEDFMNVIKEADNRSRNCFYCKAQAECKWRQERRNRTILW